MNRNAPITVKLHGKQDFCYRLAIFAVEDDNPHFRCVPLPIESIVISFHEHSPPIFRSVGLFDV